MGEVMPRNITDYYNTTNKLDFLNLIYRKRNEHHATIKLIPFEKISNWVFDEAEGNLRHVTNGFFKIQSVKSKSTVQPIINQAEHGVLGLLVRYVGDTLYCLVQMKIEPGNKDIIQISPTVQATESNYKGLHKGKRVKYIEYFLSEDPQFKNIYKQLQSEQGSKFYKKRNWNVITEVDEKVNVEESDNHYWISLSLIYELLKEDNVINMDLRSIISCLQLPISLLNHKAQNEEWLNSTVPNDYNIKNEINLREKLVYLKNQNYDVLLDTLGLALKNGWEFNGREIVNPHNFDFIVKFIDVQINSREVTAWTQPIIASNNRKLNVLYVKKFNHSYHYLIQFCSEVGLTSHAEIGPTLHNVEIAQFEEHPYAHLYKDGKVLFEALLSEEGGRFYHFENYYKVIEIPEHAKIELLSNYYWATMHSLKSLLEEPCNINIEARTLLAAFDWRLIGYEEN